MKKSKWKMCFLSKRWKKFNIDHYYPTLHYKLSDEYVVDIMLHSGEIVYMCIKWGFDFCCIEKGMRMIKNKDVNKIKITERVVVRHKRHCWIISTNYCGRCNQPRTKPLPKLCDVVYKCNYPKAYPDYDPRSRIIPKYGKKEYPSYPMI